MPDALPDIRTPPDPANKHKIVLGVDDTPRHLRLLAQCIRAGGYTFLGATSCAECMSFVARVKPRLILLDVSMPEVDGYTICRRLRADTSLNQVPIAFLTSRNTPDDVRIGLEAGANDFILKPLAFARLMERVQYWTSRRVGSGMLARPA